MTKKKQAQQQYAKSLNTPQGRINANVFLRTKIHVNDYFFHGTSLSGKKAINKKYPSFYDKWAEFDMLREGSKFRFLANPNESDDQNSITRLNYDEKDKGRGIGKRVLHDWFHGHLRKLKWCLILISFLALIISIGLFAGIEEITTHHPDFWLNPWFYVIPMFVWSSIYWLFLVRRQYHYAKFKERTLPINLKKEQDEIESRIRYLQQLDFENSDGYLSYSVLEKEASIHQVISDSYATDEDYVDKNNNRHSSAELVYDPVTGKKILQPRSALLRVRMFEPQLIQTPQGWRIDPATKIPECGYVITSFDIDTPQDAMYVRNNGIPKREIVAKQMTSDYRRRLNEPQDKSEPLYQSISSAKRKNMKEAVLIAARCHSVLTAGTGRGKTGYVLLETIIMLMYSKQMPSLFINSKGDDTKFIYNWSIVCGYNFLNYNLNNTKTADKFNPFSEAYYDAYSMYCLKTEKIEEINITPAQFMNTYFFTYRLFSFSNKMIKDNIEYVINDMRFIQINRHHITGNYLSTSREILEEIMYRTQDFTLEQDLFSNANVKLDDLSPDAFLKFFLSRYKMNRSIKVNYQIGQIKPNVIKPYITEPSQYQQWLGTSNGAFNNDWHKNDHWYLCGVYAFSNKNMIYESFSNLANEWKTGYHNKITKSITNMLDIKKEDANNFFTKTAKNLFLSVARLFLVGVLKYGPEVFAIEYFTPYNVTSNCDLLENSNYTRNTKYSDINKRLNKDNSDGPYGELVNISMPYDDKCFDGVNVETSHTPDTWNGVTGSRASLTTQLSSPDLFYVTCYSSSDLLSFFLRPTVIITVGVEGQRDDDEVKAKTSLILTIFNATYNTYVDLCKANELKSPRYIFYLLDEFVTVPWTDEILQIILIDGRSRGIYLFIIAQTRKMITQEPHSEVLLNTIKQNCALIYSLGEDDMEAAQETSDMCGTYIGRDYSQVVSALDLERNDYQRNDNLPYITKQEVKDATAGLIFGRLKIGQGSKFFKYRSLLYYNSQIRYMITHDKRISNTTPPEYNFAPITEELRFDYAIYVLLNSLDDYSELEGKDSFDRDWDANFPATVLLNINNDSRYLKQNLTLKQNNSYQEINKRNRERQEKNRALFNQSINRNSEVLNKNANQTINLNESDAQDVAVDTINFIKHDLIEDVINQGNIFNID